MNVTLNSTFALINEDKLDIYDLNNQTMIIYNYDVNYNTNNFFFSAAFMKTRKQLHFKGTSK
jgi:hypothetical protein